LSGADQRNPSRPTPPITAVPRYSFCAGSMLALARRTGHSALPRGSGRHRPTSELMRSNDRHPDLGAAPTGPRWARDLGASH
jgi:hypothetical protein